MRGGAAGYFDFLASWCSAVQRQSSGNMREADGARSWKTSPDLWYPLVLMVAGILFFSDALFSSKNFFFRDILTFHYPLHKVMIESYARGEFPLWNPYVYLGQPMLANPNYMALYPTNLFHLFLPFNYAFKLHFLVHPILGGLGLYFLQRRLGIAALAAFGGSLVYQFSGVTLSFLNLYNIVPAVALLPWIGWAFFGALYDSCWRRIVVFGAILALQIITFEPLMFQCNLWLLAGLGLLYLFESKQPLKAMGRVLRVGIAGGMFALTLAAVQAVPTLELIPRSGRAGGFDFDRVSAWSMHPLEFLNILIPNLFGDPFSLNLASYWGERVHGGREAYLVSYFIGVSTALLCLISFLSVRRNMRLVFAGVALIGASLALGGFNPMYRWMYEHVPGFSLGRYPSKYFLMSALALAILSALGLEFLLIGEKLSAHGRRELFVLGAGGIVIAVSLLGTWVWLQAHPAYLSDYIRAQTDPVKNVESMVSQLLVSLRRTGAFLLLSSGLVLGLAFWKGTNIFSWSIILTFAVELTSVNLALTPLVGDSDVAFVPEVNLYLQGLTRERTERVFHLDPPWGQAVRKLWSPTRSSAWSTYYYRLTGQPMYGINNGIQYALYESVDLLTTRESEALWREYQRCSGEDAFRLFQKLNVGQLLTVREVRDERVKLLASFNTFSERKINVFQIDAPLPRAYLVSGVERAPSPADALRRFVESDFPFKTTVILEDSRYAEKRGEMGAGMVQVVEYGNSRVVCRVDARVDGFLVLLDSYYSGWKAYVDGREAEIFRGNYAFRAVEVPMGRHEVEFRYRPKTFYVGLVLSVLALLVGGVLMFSEKQS